VLELHQLLQEARIRMQTLDDEIAESKWFFRKAGDPKKIQQLRELSAVVNRIQRYSPIKQLDYIPLRVNNDETLLLRDVHPVVQANYDLMTALLPKVPRRRWR
jgi:hypothetical protein